MNERIRELADQAVKYSLSNVNRDSEFFTPIAMEKFAELIVRECVLHLHKRGIEGFGILEERNLKEHFGVEE